MKTLKYFMALVIALCTTFTFTSCDEDDVTDAVTFANYTVSVKASSGNEVTQALVDLFTPQFTEYKKNFTNVNQLAAKKAFEAVCSAFDTKFQEQANAYNCSVTVALVNSDTNVIVESKTWAPVPAAEK